jgi:hypothetical protein
MGLADKLLAAGGVALLGALVRNGHKEAQETKRRRLSPLWFDPRLTERNFSELIQEVALRTPRVEAARVSGMTVTLEVGSISGLSTWTAEIDFNDYGRLTGAYWLDSENPDSLIPDNFADTVQAHINSRMRVDLVEEPTSPSSETTGAWAGAVPPRTLPRAGWYSDPYRRARLRYWDGRAWTGHTAL